MIWSPLKRGLHKFPTSLSNYESECTRAIYWRNTHALQIPLAQLDFIYFRPMLFILLSYKCTCDQMGSRARRKKNHNIYTCVLRARNKYHAEVILFSHSFDGSECRRETQLRFLSNVSPPGVRKIG